MKKISFLDRFGFVPKDFVPIPAKKLLPEWYKSASSYINSHEFNPECGINGKGTIKRCLPVFDIISSGYLLRTPQDIVVENSSDGSEWPWFRWAGEWELVNFHEPAQVVGYPIPEGYENVPVAKIINPWGIKTEKGYSCQFIEPSHRDNVIKILPGVVDTDQHHVPVEFPFFLKEVSFRGLIPAGTPYAQVIPFKRENFQHNLKTDKDFKISPVEQSFHRLRASFANGYRNRFWSRKNYD
jgi:hypothetical protein